MPETTTNFKKQKRGISRVHYALRTVGPDGTVTYGTPKFYAPSKTINAVNNQSSEKVFADNKPQYTSRSGIEYTRSIDHFPLTDEVLADIFNDDVITVAGTTVYGENPDAEPAEIALLYALHDGDEDKPSELVCVFRAQAQKRPDVVSNTMTSTDTASEGEQTVFDVFTPEKAWETTGHKNPAIKITVTPDIDVDAWFAQVVTWDNVQELFPAAT